MGKLCKKMKLQNKIKMLPTWKLFHLVI